MNTIKKNLIPFICGLCVASGIAFASLSEQEVKDTIFTPEIQNPKSEKATSTIKYSFGIKTIKEFASTTAPTTYEFATTTHTKEISKDEYNFCRSQHSKKYCEGEVERIVNESRTYHLEVENAKLKSLQDKLKRTDFWEELSTKQVKEL